MAQRRHTANGKAGDGAHPFRIGPAQRLAGQMGGKLRVNLMAAGREKQEKLAINALKQNGFHNLVQRAACGLCRLQRGAGFAAHQGDLGLQPRHLQRRRDPQQAFAHPAPQISSRQSGQ